MRLDSPREAFAEEAVAARRHQLNRVDAEPIIENISIELPQGATIGSAIAQCRMLVRPALPIGTKFGDHPGKWIVVGLAGRILALAHASSSSVTARRRGRYISRSSCR